MTNTTAPLPIPTQKVLALLVASQGQHPLAEEDSSFETFLEVMTTQLDDLLAMLREMEITRNEIELHREELRLSGNEKGVLVLSKLLDVYS